MINNASPSSEGIANTMQGVQVGVLMAESNAQMVSICIPAFNAAEYLCQAVKSALSQDYSNYEILIVDNDSTDQTASLIEELQKDNSDRIRCYKNDRNIGLVGNLNKCLEYAKGSYIKLLCADDLLLPGCLKQMAAQLDAHRQVKLVCSSRLIIDGKGNKLAVKNYAGRNISVPGEFVITRCLYGRNYIGEPSAVMFRKSDLKGSFRNDLPQLSDLDMWFQLLEQGSLYSIAEPLCAIRAHAGQMTHTNIKSGSLVQDNIKLFEAYSQKPYLKPSIYMQWKHRLLMTHRVWISRSYIEEEKREAVLAQHGCRWIYALMPIMKVFHGLRS